MPLGRARRRLSALPLKVKLTLWNSAVVFLVAIIALAAVREGLRWMLLKELEVALEDEIYEISLALNESYSTPEGAIQEMEQTSAGHLRHGWFVQLLDPARDEVLWSSRYTPAPLQEHASARIAEDFESDGRTYRYRERHADRTDATVRVGVDLSFISEDVNNVTRVIAPVLIGVLVIAPFGGYLLAGRTVAPLQHIISTTRMLHPDRMEERLVLRGAGDELDELSGEINAFLDEIAVHLRRNRDFVANAAHELRSPLSAIITYVDVALSRPRTAAEYEELLSTVQDNCQRLAALANQLLLLAESDAGLTTGDAACDLAEVAASCVEMFAAVADEKEIALTLDAEHDSVVGADASRLQQVVVNLVDNALKFTHRGGRVRVAVRSLKDLGHVELTVADNGVGIAKEDLASVFDRFFQADRSRSGGDRRGAGLGLSICRAIVAGLGGSIAVDGALGEGSTFTFRFPVARDGAAASEDLAELELASPRSGAVGPFSA